MSAQLCPIRGRATRLVTVFLAEMTEAAGYPKTAAEIDAIVGAAADRGA